MPSASSTKAPKFVIRTILPSTVSPTWCCWKNSSQMSVWSCLRPSDSRWFSASMLSTIASTVSPFFSASDGCFNRLLHDISEMWIRPSMPSSTSTNAPNSVRLRTLPVMFVPIGYFSESSCHGLLSTCLRPSENPPRARIDAEHHRLDAVADVEDLRRVLDALAPRHLADVDQPLDAGLELDERAVVGQADDLAGQARADRIALDHVRPRIVHQLLVAERHALGRRVVLQHDDVDLVVDLEELRRDGSRGPTTCR